MAKGMFKKLWEERGELSLEQSHTLKLELGKIDKKVKQFLERIIEADSHTVIKAYENQVKKLEEEKITLSENIARCGRPLPDFDDTFRTAAISQPFFLLEELKGVNGEMVDPSGIEPLTSSLPAMRSPS